MCDNMCEFCDGCDDVESDRRAAKSYMASKLLRNLVKANDTLEQVKANVALANAYADEFERFEDEAAKAVLDAAIKEAQLEDLKADLEYNQREVADNAEQTKIAQENIDKINAEIKQITG